MLNEVRLWKPLQYEVSNIFRMFWEKLKTLDITLFAMYDNYIYELVYGSKSVYFNEEMKASFYDVDCYFPDYDWIVINMHQSI